jgi:hypothetical protein
MRGPDPCTCFQPPINCRIVRACIAQRDFLPSSYNVIRNAFFRRESPNGMKRISFGYPVWV